MYRLLEVQLQLPDKESTKGAAPLATVFQVSGPAINKKPKKNLKKPMKQEIEETLETYKMVISKVFPLKTRQLGFVWGNTSNEDYYSI